MRCEGRRNHPERRIIKRVKIEGRFFLRFTGAAIPYEGPRGIRMKSCTRARRAREPDEEESSASSEIQQKTLHQSKAIRRPYAHHKFRSIAVIEASMRNAVTCLYRGVTQFSDTRWSGAGANGWAVEGPCGMIARNQRCSFTLRGMLEVLGAARR